jgi:hypothetical protein
MRETLFRKVDFQMHSGGIAHYKIECDALTDGDIETLAWIIAQKSQQMTGEDRTGIRDVYGVPRGGCRLANALQKHRDRWGSIRLIVDDVLTTGASMEKAKSDLGWTDAYGVVIFARHQCPSWVYPVFSMQYFNVRDEL